MRLVLYVLFDFVLFLYFLFCLSCVVVVAFAVCHCSWFLFSVDFACQAMGGWRGVIKQRLETDKHTHTHIGLRCRYVYFVLLCIVCCSWQHWQQPNEAAFTFVWMNVWLFLLFSSAASTSSITTKQNDSSNNTQQQQHEQQNNSQAFDLYCSVDDFLNLVLFDNSSRLKAAK